jgi:hypothetical protein
MKLTRKQLAIIGRALLHARRANTYLLSDKVAVCHRIGVHGGTALDYRRTDGAVLAEVEKSYASGLCGLEDCIRELERLVAVVPMTATTLAGGPPVDRQ